jgi:Ca2+-binding EF-hand superfamily protein
MKRKTKIAIAAATLAGATALAATSFAGGGMGHRGGGGHGGSAMGMHGGGSQMMQWFDLDKDGKLTQEEIDRARTERVNKFDKDGDGALNLAEYQALWMDAMRERMVDRFQGHDDDGDGKITQEEFGRHFANMVRYMDSNCDGVLDENDMGRRHRGESKHDG